MTSQYKKMLFYKAMQKRESLNSLNGLINWNLKIGLIPNIDAIYIRNQRAKELNFGKKETYFKLG